MIEDNKKLPHELSLQDLVDAISGEYEEIKFIQNPNKRNIDHDNDHLGFLSEFNIKPGKHLINAKFLYKIYTNWSKDPISSVNFNNQMINFYTSKFISQNLYFRIDKDRFQVSDILYQHKATKVKSKFKSPFYRRNFEDFLLEFKIKKGNNAVPHAVLHQFYQEWCKNKKKTVRLSYKQFQLMFRVFFPPSPLDSRDWVRIDTSIHDVVPATIIKEKISEFRQVQVQRAEKSRHRTKAKAKLYRLSRLKSSVQSEDS